MFYGFIFFIFGLLVGSFINSFLWRYQTKTTYKGRSMCPTCKHQLAWYDNIPLISWFMLGGKCRYCKKSISVQYPVVELLTGLAFLFVGLLSKPGLIVSQSLMRILNFQLQISEQMVALNALKLLVLLLIAAILVTISVYDYKTKEIPNGFNLTFVLLASGYSLINNIIINYDPIAFLLTLIAGLTAFLFFYSFVFFSKETWMGGADAKLAFGMGILLGPGGVFLATFFASVVGATIGLTLIALKKAGPKTSIPFGPFLALGTVISLLFGSQLVDWYVRIFLRI
jgi:prepilin signal peptidase PulO-like enzyme (type II secretory pathway)